MARASHVVLPLHIAPGMLPPVATSCEPPSLEPSWKFRPSSRVMARSLFAATLLVLSFVALVSREQCPHRFAESKLEVARLRTAKYALEAYPEWRANHPGHECPKSLAELARYVDSFEPRDPWGHAYMFTCGGGRLYVVSLGEDGKANTADDIWSHE